MKKQVKMGFCYYRKIALVLILSFLLQAILPATLFASYVVWPSEQNLYNDTIDFDAIVATTSTVSDTKKGFLFTGDPREVFYLNAKHIAINVTLSGLGHAVMQYLDGFKKRGVEITLILINDKAPVGTDPSKAPKIFRNPYCYLIDFSANNGEWQKYNFDRVVDDYVDYVDNWVIGNEINSQMYGFYGAASIEEYTKKYCDNFKIIYNKIKSRNKNANIYISFEQGWDIPQLDRKNKKYDATMGQYRYNAKEQLNLINTYLDKNIDWGVSLHPYPTPIESGHFWDGQYTGYDIKDPVEDNRPYLTTIKNFEVALAYLSEERFLKKDKKIRNIIISEIGITSHDGEEAQAAGLYYLWEKVKDNDLIKFFLYNAQTDLMDGFNFGLTSNKDRKRLIWTVFRDMDDEKNSAWCKDLLDRVLEENGYIDNNGIIEKIEDDDAKIEEEKKANIIWK